MELVTEKCIVDDMKETKAKKMISVSEQVLNPLEFQKCHKAPLSHFPNFDTAIKNLKRLMGKETVHVVVIQETYLTECS